MSAEVIVTGIRGANVHSAPFEGKLTVRGRGRKSARPGKCDECGDEIAVGEQYIRCGGEVGISLCLGCAEYS